MTNAQHNPTPAGQPGFLYFLPGRKGLPAGELDLLHLDHLADGQGQVAHLATRELLAGPGSASGLLLAVTTPGAPAQAADLVYDPARQHWRPTVNGWHLGWPQASLVRPAALERPELVGGYNVPLEDGCDWLVPVARRYPEGSEFPMALAIGPDGKLVRSPLARWREACRMADEIWNALRTDYGDLAQSEEPTAISEERGFELACRILAINYRVGAAEISALGCLTTANMPLVLRAFVDWPRYHQAQQKKTAAKAAAAKAAEAQTSATGSGA